MSWKTDNLMAFITLEGMWVLFDVEKNLKLEAYHMIQNFDIYDFSSPHANLQPACINEDKPFERLLRRN